MLVCWVFALSLGVCGEPAPTEKRLQVVTSFLPVYCFAANVAGDLADVRNLLPPNVGPHDYQPTPGDAKKMLAADVLILNGLKLEEWSERLIRARGNARTLTVVEVWKGSEAEWIREVPGLDLESAKSTTAKEASPHGNSGSGSAADPNPHLWLDPVLARHAVTNLLNVFQQQDPKNAAGYARNADAFLERLRRLDADFQETLKPMRGIPLVAFHDAFVYAARRYGLRIVGVIEEVPEVSPSAKYLGRLRHLIQSEKVRAIFAEPQFPPRVAERLAGDTGVPLGLLDTLETVPSGELTPDAYEVGMRANLKVLATLLK